MSTVTAAATAPTRLVMLAELVRRHDMTAEWSDDGNARRRAEEQRQQILSLAAGLPKGEVLAIVDIEARKEFPDATERRRYLDLFERDLDRAQAGTR